MTRSPRDPRALGAAGLVLALSLGLAACGASGDGGDGGDAKRDETSAPPSAPTSGATSSAGGAPDDLSVARNETREDSVYPEVGDPTVDALHYALALTWDPTKDRLGGEETLTFRATADAAAIPLDFNDQLAISELTVDGEPAEFEIVGKDLAIAHPVQADQQYVVGIEYAGTPAPTPAPSERGDFAGGLGWSITDEHETWTLQEPYGAFTWYAVNDQPSDKALYDFTLSVPAPWQGVANGELTESTESDGLVTNTWHLAEPASSYLVTVAFGDFQVTDLESASGVPLQVWTDADGDPLPGDTDFLPEAVDWVEDKLGPYPFDSLGIVVVDNESGMETQTMITLGDIDYSLSAAVVLHEAVHQWYGDTVSPNDWSEVWMNEGWAMYLQGMWEAEQEGVTVEEKMDSWAELEESEREYAGPPAAYDEDKFGASNIYYGPALMWHELRELIGDDEFFALAQQWPEQQENDTADREEYWTWIEQTTGEELTAFFESWLLGRTTPPR